MSTYMLEKMEAKLKRLIQEFYDLQNSNPAIGHGGTPIVDNSKGKMLQRKRDKLEQRLKEQDDKIEKQKEKIERYKWRMLRNSTPTKKSEIFIKKNPIHPALLIYAEKGILKQWVKNPHFFFINSLKRIALITVDGKVGVSARFRPSTEEDFKVAKALANEINEFKHD
jgi:hypothetical protein